MNTALEDLAKKIISEAKLKEENFGSAIIVLTMISILVGIIRVIQECNKNKLSNLKFRDRCNLYSAQIKELSVRSGWFTKMKLKKIIRQNMPQKEYKLYGNQILEAILAVGQDLSYHDTELLLQASEAIE